MTKFLILLVSMASLAAAGVLDNRWMLNDRSSQINGNLRGKSIQGIDIDPIQRMSSNDLLRQKFLLKVLDHVNEPTIDEEILQNSDNFDIDQNSYNGGIDEDMMYFIDLCRSSRLLGKNQIYTISNPEHMIQMVGLTKLLARSRDWHTFTKNVCCARQNANGVLFVNALLLALRERDDCRNLIVPGIHEILPELYLNKNTIRQVRNLDINLMTQSNGRDTMRPNLFDMIGFGGRNNMVGMQNNRAAGMWSKSQKWQPWREMRMQMAMQKSQNAKGLIKSDFEDKIVIPVQQNIDSIRDNNLLTEDVGLKSFLHLTMNDLCLRENELQNMGMGRVRMDRNFGGTILDRDDNEWNGRLLKRRPSVDADRNWMLRENIRDGRRAVNSRDDGVRTSQWQSRTEKTWNHMNEENGNPWRKISSIDDMDKLDEDHGNTFNIGRGSRVHDVRNVMGSQQEHQWWPNSENEERDFDLNRLDRWSSRTDRENDWNMNQVRQNAIRSSVSDRELPTISVDDDRLLHVNRRRLIDLSNTETMDSTHNRPLSMKNRFMNILHRPQVHDVRKTLEENSENPRSLNNMLWGVGRPILESDEDMNDPRMTLPGNWQRMNKQQDEETMRPMGMGMMIQNRQRVNLPTTSVNDDRLLHVNRRRLLQQDDVLRNNNEMRGNRIRFVSDMRKIKDDDSWSQGINKTWNRDTSDEERMRGIRTTSISNDRLLHINRRRMMDDEDTDHEIRSRRVRDTRSMIGMGIGDSIGNALDSDVLLHNIKQILARIEIDQISTGSSKSRMIQNELTNWQIHQGHGLDMNSNNQMNIGILNDIENKVHNLINQISRVGRDGSVPMNVDRQIADIMIGQQGNTNVVNIIRDLVAATGNVQRNEDSLQNLGIDMKNTLVQNVMQRLNEAVDEYRTNVLGPYTRRELGLDGVTINDVTVDDLKTTVDQHDIDVRNLLDSRIELDRTDQKMVVVREQRLNHKDFTIKIDLNSDRNQRVIVRTMLGPKTDSMGRELTLDERRQNFLLIDTNIVDLQAGKNVIKRKSREIMWTARDTTPITKIYQRVMMALGSGKNIEDLMPMMKTVGQDCRFPHRLLLPRGRPDGLKMQLLVIVTPIEGNVQQRDDIGCAMGVGTTTLDDNSLGFPLDRRIDNMREWMALPNMKVVDVTIRNDGKKTDIW